MPARFAPDSDAASFAQRFIAAIGGRSTRARGVAFVACAWLPFALGPVFLGIAAPPAFHPFRQEPLS